MINMKIMSLLFLGMLLLMTIPMVDNVKAVCGDTQIIGFNSVFTGTTYSIENYIYGTENISGGSGCYQSSAFYHISISVYLAVTSASHKVKCCLYYATVLKREETEEKTVGVGTGWVTFNFNLIRGYEYLDSGYYSVYVWAESTTGDCRIYTDTGARNNEYVYYQNKTYAKSFPNPCVPLFYNAKKMSIYATIRSFYMSPISVYPITGSYTYTNVTLSFLTNANGAFNYSLYKKIGASSYWLSSYKNNCLCDNTVYYDRFFNATTLNTLYTWKVCLRNYTYPVWFNYTYTFYINDSTVHLSDTKTNVAGTLTSIRNNTGFWITSIHNSSITKKDRTVNSSLTHVYYWVTNTWVDYANSTGNVTAIHTSDTKKNVTGSLSYSLNGTGYWVTSIHESKLSQFTNLINAYGTHTGAWNGASWVDYANITGNASSCNSTNLTLYENFVDAAGTHQSFYDPLLGWFAWANVTGNASTNITGNYTVGLNFTGFNGYIVWSGDHTENKTNISFPVTSNMSINGSVHVDEDAYFLSGMLSFDPAVMILSLFFGFFYIGYESKKRSGGFFMLFAGFLLIALGVLVYGMLGYAAVLVMPFAIFIMLLGGKKAFYGPETEEPQGNKPTK